MGFERRHLGGRAYALVASNLEDVGFLAAFSERTGGSSSDPFASLNVSFTVGDDPLSVAANRRRLADGLMVSPFAVAGLAHGPRIRAVGRKRAGAGFEGPRGVVARSDGLYTSSPGVSLAVTLADCVPLVMASPSEGRLALVHAGWRGIAAGLVERAAGLFGERREVRVAIGPAIGPCHYEVGEDVALAVAAASEAGAVTERRAGHLYLDLVGTARRVLRAAGIRRVEDTGLCTACERRRFFSHRRDGRTGRQAAVAVRLPG